jgi:hypothetical protein
VIKVKILSLGEAERYSVRRLVLVAQHDLEAQGIQVDLTIKEVNSAGEIGKVAPTLVLPTLVVNEKVVSSGRFPQKEEIVKWLVEAANPEPIATSLVQNSIKE